MRLDLAAVVLAWAAGCAVPYARGSRADDGGLSDAPAKPAIARGLLGGSTRTLDAGCRETFVVRDDFSRAAIASSWVVWSTGEGGSIGTMGGRLRIAPPSGAPAYLGMSSSMHSVAGSYLRVRLATMVNTSTTAQVFVTWTDADGTKLQFLQEAGSLVLEVIRGGVSDRQVFPYDPVAHRYWQLREHDGRIAFEISREGTEFTTLRDLPLTGYGDTARVELGAGTYEEVASPGMAELEGIEWGPPAIRCR